VTWDYTITDDVTFYADWTENKYYVTYDGNGNTSGNVPNDSNYYLYLTSAFLYGQNTLEKEGYSFTGWNTEANGTGTSYAINQIVSMTDDLTLYAQWEINEYTITFDSNGGSEVLAITEDYNTSVTKPTDPTKNNYTFAGWYSDEELTSAVTWDYTITADVTFYADWTINEYTIIFNSNGGSTVSAITEDYNKSITVPTIPIKNGFIFEGWNTKTDGTGLLYNVNDNLVIIGNITLYALWNEDYHVDGIDDNGSTSVDLSSDEATVVGDVIADLGDIEITTSGSLYEEIIGDDETNSLRLIKTNINDEIDNAVKKSVGKNNAVVVSFDLSLEKIYSDGKAEQIHNFNGSMQVVVRLTAEQISAITNMETAKIYWYSPDKKTLTDMNAIINLEAGTATFTTNHFSTFIIANVISGNNVRTDEYVKTYVVVIIIVVVVVISASLIIFFIFKKKKKQRETKK
jgi:uncharacterized repeat protein (TIGR02543 family)